MYALIATISFFALADTDKCSFKFTKEHKGLTYEEREDRCQELSEDCQVCACNECKNKVDCFSEIHSCTTPQDQCLEVSSKAAKNTIKEAVAKDKCEAENCEFHQCGSETSWCQAEASASTAICPWTPDDVCMKNAAASDHMDNNKGRKTYCKSQGDKCKFVKDDANYYCRGVPQNTPGDDGLEDMHV